jgi:hypothetical protein
MTILFMILWCAVMKELLENHQDRHLYEEMIVRVNFIITAFAFTLMFFVPFVPMYFLYQVMKKAGQLVTGPDAVLNEIYMTAHNKKMKRRKDHVKLDPLGPLGKKERQRVHAISAVGKRKPNTGISSRHFVEEFLINTVGCNAVVS